MSSNYWSTFVQNSDFLESSRIEIMNADMAAYVADKLGLKPGMRVLDVGCGTGALEYYLAHVSENVQYTGIDTDSDLIACAGGKPHSDSRRNSFTFIECDASKLPFPDSSFDVVVSHTFLTAAVCYEAALLEMKRVCVPEGLIGTINIADFTKAVIRREGWRSKSEADFRFGILLEKFLSSCERLYPLSRAREGISPERIPSFFEDSGLKDVSVFPVGSFFSLSNGEQVLPANVRKSYLDGMLSSLFKRISAYEALPGFCRIMPGSELKELKELASARCTELLSGVSAAKDWGYDAFLYLLITGKNCGVSGPACYRGSEHSCGRMGKFKDAAPEETLLRIRSILNRLGLRTEECFTGSGMEGLYSCRVTVDGTDIGQNGKGTTPEYALASGYAEFMERLSTGFLVPFDAPDREILSEISCIEEGGDVLKTVFSRLYGIPLFMTDPEHILRQWSCAEEVTCTGSGFPGYRFHSLRDGESFFLPEFVYRNFTYTNGSCAGNTREEAMVQGLCEITERYAMLKILGDRLSPPEIPESELVKHTGVYSLVSAVRRQTGMKLYILDASLGLELPVVCALLLNPADKSACVKFGAHPCFDVALERALTELLQGRHVDRFTGMCPIGAEYEQDTARPENLFNMLKVGLGTVSVRILDGIWSKPDWEYRQWQEPSGGNPELLERMLALCGSLGWDVFYRDCSFFSFPVFHMFIPQCSMIMSNGKADIARVMARTKHLKSLRNFPGADDVEKQKAVMTARMYSGMVLHDNLDMLSGIGFHAQIDGVKINYTLLAALYDIERKDYGAAAEKLKHHSGLNETLWCLEELCAAECNSADISPLLASAVQDRAALNSARMIFESPCSVLPGCTFPNCGECERREQCDTYRVRSLAGLKQTDYSSGVRFSQPESRLTILP